MFAIVDAGPLFASLDANDRHHAASARMLLREDLQLIVPALVVAEVAYLAGRWLGARIEAVFLRSLADFYVMSPDPQEWLRIADLVQEYADFPLGGTDASVMVLAERFETDTILTLDRRHFSAVRPRHCAAFRILPE